MAHRVTLIPGDGTGPELTEATRRVLEATGVDFDWDVQYAGSDVMDQYGGNPLPDQVLEAIRESGIAIKGPITTPIGGGFRSVNVALRKGLDLYGQVRPCKSYPGVRSRYEDVDLVIVRETTEDLYAGIEWEVGSDEARELTEWIRERGGTLRDEAGISIKPISVEGTRRIIQFAFDYARRLGRHKVTTVHKANIMKFTDGLWLQISREVAEQNTDIEFEDRIVDNLCMQLVQRPEEYDVLVLLEPLRRHRLGSGGGPDRRARARAGRQHRDRRRRLRAHPRLGAEVRGPEQGEPDGDDAVGDAHAPPPRGGGCCRPARAGDRGGDRGRCSSVTYDMKPSRDDPTAVGTSEVADAVIEKLGVRV